MDIQFQLLERKFFWMAWYLCQKSVYICESIFFLISFCFILATSCEELTHWKRPWCWEGLGAGGEGDDRGWDGWMASLTWWTWVWVNSGSCWWTGRPGVLRFMGSQRVGHDWVTEQNRTDIKNKNSALQETAWRKLKGGSEIGRNIW